MIPWWSTEFGLPEISAVAQAIQDRKLSQGSITREFESRLAERLGVPYVVCTTSGTTALTMACLVGEPLHGTECWLPDRTWIATAHAAILAGLKVRLVDVLSHSPVMDISAVQADQHYVIPVLLNGRRIDLTALDTGWIIADACQAFPYFPEGCDIACYSLSVAKVISTGQGGFCATQDEGIYRELLALRTHDVADAMVPQVLKWKRFGYNFRFTDIQAAIGLAQLDRLDHRLEALAEIHAAYKDFGVPVLGTPTPLYNEMLHVEPERLRAHLLAHGIEARPFYPPLHTAEYLHANGKFPNSDAFSHGLILPSGPCQKISDIERVAEVYHSYRQ